MILDPYEAKALEYLVGIMFLVLFALFWHYATGTPRPKRERRAPSPQKLTHAKHAATATAILLVASLAGAATLKLPGPIVLPQSPDSPGKVTFTHETHVDAGQPRCTACHPREFRILKATKRTAITHERMDKGGQCGSCHNGTAAFALDQDCTFCHGS
jgi:c(7)-type cytochrome triheme protein